MLIEVALKSCTNLRLHQCLTSVCYHELYCCNNALLYDHAYYFHGWSSALSNVCFSQNLLVNFHATNMKNLSTTALMLRNLTHEKEGLQNFLSEVFYFSVQGEKVLIIDEWNGYKDSDGSLKSLVPERLQFTWNRFLRSALAWFNSRSVFLQMYKNLSWLGRRESPMTLSPPGYITDMILVLAPDYQIWDRTDFFKLQSFARLKFLSGIFNMRKCAFYKAE